MELYFFIGANLFILITELLDYSNQEIKNGGQLYKTASIEMPDANIFVRKIMILRYVFSIYKKTILDINIGIVLIMLILYLIFINIKGGVGGSVFYMHDLVLFIKSCI